MTGSAEPAAIRWRLHLMSPPEIVYGFLSTDEGHARFWAKSAVERGGSIDFRFPNGLAWRGRILERRPPTRFAVEYFGGSTTTFELAPDGRGGTDLTLTDAGVPQGSREETSAGWVSVLLVLKVAADHGVDLRVHDASRTWDQGFADN